MGGEVETIGIAEARSALAWWLEAGVDTAVQEEPRNWLKPAPRRAPQAQPQVAEKPSTPVHDTLEAFRDWLATSEHLPMAGRSARRVLPHGPDNARVMLLADAPDDPSGPISGEALELAKRMLTSISISAEEAYFATLSCFHAPGVRLNADHRQAWGEIARRHVRLAAPERLLLFGEGPAQALLGKPLLQVRGHIHKIEGVRTVATFHPRHLIKRTLDKSLAWQDLLLLTGNES